MFVKRCNWALRLIMNQTLSNRKRMSRMRWAICCYNATARCSLGYIRVILRIADPVFTLARYQKRRTKRREANKRGESRSNEFLHILSIAWRNEYRLFTKCISIGKVDDSTNKSQNFTVCFVSLRALTNVLLHQWSHTCVLSSAICAALLLQCNRLQRIVQSQQ